MRGRAVQNGADSEQDQLVRILQGDSDQIIVCGDRNGFRLSLSFEFQPQLFIEAAHACESRIVAEAPLQ